MASEPVPSRDVGNRTSRVDQPVMVTFRSLLNAVIDIILVVLGVVDGVYHPTVLLATPRYLNRGRWRRTW